MATPFYLRSAFLAVLLVAGPGAAAPPDPADLAARIDRRIDAVLKADGVPPAPPADDAEFLRRASLDVIGRIPRPAEVHAFLADPAPDKRRQAIDRLLEDPHFAVHFANLWRAELAPEITARRDAEAFQVGFEAWLRQRIRAGIGYDRLVRELLTVPLSADGEPALRDPDRPNPLAFIAVKEAKPENLAAAVTRTFLGIRLECAQCHNHPFAKWRQEQFWGQAAFFAGVQRQSGSLFGPIREVPGPRELAPAEGRKPVGARFLAATGQAPAASRADLAAWVTAPDNPYFAPARANRLWGHFFGTGLVEPVDDFRDDNPPSDPALLAEVAEAFAAAQFDVRYLIRGLCLTRAYRRTSARTHPGQDGARLPARMAVKALTGEQFFDSLALATGYRPEQDRGAARRQIVARFAQAGPGGEPETSVQQALTLANGRFVAWATDPAACPTLIAVTQTPGMTLPERLEALYLATLSRKPTAAELARLQGFVGGVESGREAERLADVFWMLLNSAEFRLNH
jgi:hypothetical protein